MALGEENNRITPNKDNGPSKISVEVPLNQSFVGRLIKALRKIRKYSQTRLGRLLGVNKAQVSKLENSSGNLTLNSLLKVFGALKAKVTISVEVPVEDERKHLEKIKAERKEEKSEK
jgi:HTH-type transcriptional regulator / antitoxin HipB